MNIALTRLANQAIANPTFDQPGAVVKWLVALQAQDYGGTLWAIGLRIPGATEQHIEQAIADRAIIRTWPLRGTLHFVAPQDVRWLLQLLTPRIITQSATRYRQLELDEAIFARSKEVFAKALQGGKQLTRDEMLQVLEQANIATDSQRGYHIFARSAQDGLICFGAPRAKQQTFTLLDEWVSQTNGLTDDEALAELTRRYFTSHGPATLQDFVWWAGITVTQAKLGLEVARSKLIRETVDGRDYWLAYETQSLGNDSPAAYLLPGFDEYLLGYTDRSAVLDQGYTQQVCPGGNGIFMPTIVIDGRVVGTWKRVLKKDRVVIALNPFTFLSEAELQAVAIAAQRFAVFVGLPMVLA